MDDAHNNRGFTPAGVLAFLGDAILAPTSAFQRLSPAWGWVLPLAIVATATVIIQLATIPFTVAVLRRLAAAAVNDEILAGVERWMTGLAFMRAGWVALKAALICWVLWLTLSLKDQDVSTRQLMVIASYATMALVAEDAIRLAVLWLKGVEQIRGPQDLQSYVGLDAFIDVDGRNLATKMMLSQISLFSLWFVTLIRGGLIGLAGVQRRVATVTGLLCWAYLLVLQLGTGIVISSIQGRGGAPSL